MLIDKKLSEIIKELSGKEQFSIEDRLQEDIGLDSLGMVMLLIEVEEKFSLELNETDMNPFELSSVKDVINLIKKYLDEGSEEKGEEI